MLTLTEEFIYKLIDPDTYEVRYIGRTNEPEARLRAHIYQARANTSKDDWIRELRSRELYPIMEIIEKASGNGAEREKYWIAHYQQQGATLFNKLHNGQKLNIIGYTKSRSKANILMDCLKAAIKLPNDLSAQDRWVLITLIEASNGEETPQIYKLDDLAEMVKASVKGLYTVFKRLQSHDLLTIRPTHQGTIITVHIHRLLSEMEEGN